MDHVPELSAYLELVFDVDVTVTEVSNVPPCVVKQVGCHWKAVAVQCNCKHIAKMKRQHHKDDQNRGMSCFICFVFQSGLTHL